MSMQPYRSLALILGINLFIMWALTYLGVYAFDHIHLNLNRLYMAVAMVAPMAVLMLTVMHRMFPDTRTNLAWYVGAALVFLAAVTAIQTQAGVGDEELMQAMIPHHSIAIKNCERADLDDPEVITLCDQIIAAQREEIATMKEILARSY